MEMIPEIKKILYATDLSKNSSYAFFYAVDMARKYDARIVMLHAVEPGHSLSYAGSMVDGLMKSAKRGEQQEDCEEIKEGLREFCNRIQSQVGCPCVELVSKIVVPLGHPVEEILKVADHERCDVIVLGSHGRGLLRQTLLGSTAHSLLQRTRKPVVIVPIPSDKTDVAWDSV